MEFFNRSFVRTLFFFGGLYCCYAFSPPPPPPPHPPPHLFSCPPIALQTCAVDGCTTEPSYGAPGCETEFCLVHSDKSVHVNLKVLTPDVPTTLIVRHALHRSAPHPSPRRPSSAHPRAARSARSTGLEPWWSTASTTRHASADVTTVCGRCFGPPPLFPPSSYFSYSRTRLPFALVQVLGETKIKGPTCAAVGCAKIPSYGNPEAGKKVGSIFFLLFLRLWLLVSLIAWLLGCLRSCHRG